MNMNFVSEHIWLILVAFLLIVSIVVNVCQYFNIGCKDSKNIETGHNMVSKSKHQEKLILVNNLRDKIEKLESEKENAWQKINSLERTVNKLLDEKSELQRKCDELSHLSKRTPSECNLVSMESFRADRPYTSEPTKQEAWQSTSSEYVTMYASMARQVDNRAYFSDISDNIKDDSYFVLTIHKSSETATYKPLDFMKIRGYDPVMSAIRTEGAKPHAATAVLSIEPGEAHLEGKDWFIDKYTTIKLA